MSTAQIEVKDEVVLVASLRLPISLGGIVAVVDWLEKQYGGGLTMRQDGEFILVEQKVTSIKAVRV